MTQYVPLHVHSMYSLLDGLSQPKHIAKRCLEIGAKTCAITDHGNIAGHVAFHKTMTSNGIKPILGCELYICEKDSHIKDKTNSSLSDFLVLAKNLQGWKTLINIVSTTNSPQNFYHKPRISFDK